jgi:hypothetical protein
VTLDSGVTLLGTSSGGGLNNVSLTGDLDLATNNGAVVTVSNGLTFSGTIAVGNPGGSNHGTIMFNTTQTIGGMGSILFGGSASNALTTPSLFGTLVAVTLGPSLTVHGAKGALTHGGYLFGGFSSYIVQGTVSADVMGGALGIDFGNVTSGPNQGTNAGTLQTPSGGLAIAGTWTNSGTLDEGGGALTLGGTWTNTGTLSASGGSLTFNGNATWSTASALTAASATVSFAAGALTAPDGTPLLLSGSGSTWQLAGGFLSGTVTLDSRVTLLGTTSGGGLTNVSLTGNLDLATNNGAVVTVSNGLTLSGTIFVGNTGGNTNGSLIFNTTETIGGTGDILFGASASNALTTPSLFGTIVAVTLGPGLTVHGAKGALTNGGYLFGGFSSYIVQGTVSADVTGGALGINFGNITSGPNAGANTGTLEAPSGGLAIAGTWTNSGTLDEGGGALTLGGTWSNSGPISVSGGTLNLGGTFTLAPSATFSRSGGTVNLTGTLNNVGSMLALNATTGTWNLQGGAITGGTVTQSDSALLVDTSSGTLSGLTLNGNLDLTTANGVSVTVVNGLTLNGTISVGNSAGTTYGSVIFNNTETIGGMGDILLGRSASNALTTPSLFGTLVAVTLGPGLTVHGAKGALTHGAYFFGGFSSYIVQGTVSADVPDGALSIDFGNVTSGPSQGANTGTLSASGGGLILTGTAAWSTASALTATGATVTFSGTLTNTGSTLTLVAGTGGAFRLASGGSIVGGTITGAALTGVGGTLNGVTLNSNLDLTTAGVSVTVVNGLTLNGTISVGNSAGTTSGYIYFVGSNETVGGSGSILLGGSASNTLSIYASNLTVTLGPSLNVHGKSGALTNGGYPGTAYVNQGAIQADVTGGTITLTNCTNSGTFVAANGGALDLRGSGSSSGAFTAAAPSRCWPAARSRSTRPRSRCSKAQGSPGPARWPSTGSARQPTRCSSRR